MGIFGSSEENNEMKTVDSTGQVNNNIVIQEAADTHHQMITSEKLLFATYLLVFFEIIKLIVFGFTAFKRKIKKNYQNRNNVNGNANNNN